MWKKITRFISITLVCCLCSGIVAQAEEPYAESVDMLQLEEEVESTEEETEDKNLSEEDEKDKETTESEEAEPGNAELGSEYPETASEPKQEDSVQEEQERKKRGTRI